MKFSSNTLKILKNFSDINNAILIKKGKTLITVDPAKRIIADASIDESLPRDFAIYDLSKFLGVTSLFDNPDLDFKNDKVVVKSDNRSIDFIYSDPSVVTDAYTIRNTKIPSLFTNKSVIQKMTITESDLRDLKQASSILGLSHISFIGDDSSIKLVAQDPNNTSLGKFTLNLQGESVGEFTCNMLFENLKIIVDTYEVEISPQVAHFTGQTTGIQYWIVMESN
jgi:hypothetical protein